MNKISTTSQLRNGFAARVTVFAVFLSAMLMSNFASAQLAYTETFDVAVSTTTIPLGWSTGKVGAGSDPDNYWDRVTVGGNPAATPFGGSGAMMRYLSWYTVAGEASFLATKRFAMDGVGAQAMPVGGATFSFQFWRDNNATYASTPDKIQVYLNTTPDMAGTPVLIPELTSGTNSTEINRSNTLAPVTATNGWVQYTYNIPKIAPWTGNSVYVVIVATSGDGNNMFLDNFTITSYPALQAFAGPPAATVWNQNSFNTGVNQVAQQIIGCKITMTGAYNPKVLTGMEFNTNGCTSPSPDITNAKLYFTGGTPTFDISNAVLMGTCAAPVIYATNYMFLTAVGGGYTGLTSFNGLEVGDNYFWITYDIAPGATPLNYVDAEWIGLNVGAGPVVPSVQTLPGNRLIDVLYCIPTYSAGTSWASYNNNDYVRSLVISGLPGPDLNNNKNWITAQPSPSASEGCNVGPWPKDCYYQKHGPDYELFAEALHPGYPRVTTKTFKADGLTTYTITVQAGTWGGSNYIGAFIDYNKDGDFVDAGEKIAQSGSLLALGTYTTTFTVPTTATSGKTRLRVREIYATSNVTPCNSATWGETEDYVITIIPDCPTYPFYTTWLGLTNNWNDPNNWCPAIVPTLTTNVRLPGGPSGAYTYVRPKIQSNVTARAQKLRIEANDTLFIDAITASSLTITDSLKIWTPTSALKVNTTFIDTAQVFNGTLNRPATENPLNPSMRVRSFLAFMQTDLQAQGLQTGDVITNILMHLQRNSNGNPYKNLEVKYFYTTSGQASFAAAPPTLSLPTPTGLPATPVTIFNGDLNVASFISAGSSGTVDLTLTTPIVWNGGVNPLIIEICYDNTGFPSTGTVDYIRFTQTTSWKRYMNIRALTDYPTAACNMSTKDTVIIPCTWTAGSPIVNVVGPDAAIYAAKVRPGQLIVSAPSPLGQVVNVVGTVITMSNNAPASGTAVNVSFTNVDTKANIWRPNLTFKYTRPYIKYPIAVAGHWENNGLFVPDVSRVTLNGTILNQKIEGDSSTEFYDLNIQNSNHVLRMTDFTVTDSLRLVSGRLKLNNGKVTLTNPAISALTRVNGYIQAETDAVGSNAFPYGRVYWKMGSVTGLRVIPFANTANVSIPLDYTIDSGTHDVIIGTYNTVPSNLNLPLPEVTNVFGFNGTAWNSDGSAVVDRYFLVKDSLGATPQADITFRWATTERAANNPTGALAMSAQRWLKASSLWEFPYIAGQAYSIVPSDQMVITNYTDFSANNWWNIVGTSTPLPVSLLDFRAEQYKDKVKLLWTTASEINNSHFEIERTVNSDDFEFIGRVQSKGPGNNIQEYSLWDTNPLEGNQYYYLRQYDYDGKMESFGPVSARFTTDIFDIVTATVSSSDRGLTVVFNYNSTEPYSYKIMDMTGRVIVSKDRNAAVDGLNVIDIDATLAKGAYHIILQNSSKVVSRKFFY